MNHEGFELSTIKQKVIQFYNNGSNHQELVDIINNNSTLRLCYEFYTDTNLCVKHFGITGLINKIKKQLISDSDLIWLNNQVDRNFYDEMTNSLYFIKMVAYLKLNLIPKQEVKSILSVIKDLPSDNERKVSHNQILVSNMFEILNSRDVSQNVLSCLSQILHEESVEILHHVIEIGKSINDINVQLLTLKSLSFLYNYSPDNSRSIPELQDFVMQAVLHPELFSEAVDLLTNILITSNLSNSNVDLIIRYTLMQNRIVGIVIHDQKEAVRNKIEWRDRDNSEKQMAYALCEYLGSLINLSFENLVAFFTNNNDINPTEKESVGYLLNLLLQLLSIDGDIPKYNDIFIGIVNNVHILLEEVLEVFDGVTPVILEFQRNLIDIFYAKLKHPFSFGSMDIDMDEFLDNRDNVNYAFESMNRPLLCDWLKEKLFTFFQSENISISDVETVLYFYSQIPDFTQTIMPFEQIHSIFERAFVKAGEFQETLMDTYIVLLKEIFPIMTDNDTNVLISFIWDILKNYQPAIITASSLLSSIYLSEHIDLVGVDNPRETETLMLIKHLTQDDQPNPQDADAEDSWKEYSATLYSIVGRLSILCANNEQLTSLSGVFINPVFERINSSIEQITNKRNQINLNGNNLPQTVDMNSNNSIADTQNNSNNNNQNTNQNNVDLQIDDPHEIILSNQLTLIASFLSPHTRLSHVNCHQFIIEMLNALIDQLTRLANVVLYSVEFYSSMLKLVHGIVSLTPVIEGPPDTIQRLADFLTHFSTTLYREHSHRKRPACLELAVASLHCIFQHCVSSPHHLSAKILIYFSNLLLDYTFNRCPPTPNYYMPTFISRCLRFLHSALVDHGPPNQSQQFSNHKHYFNNTSVVCTCLEHTPNIQRVNLSTPKLNWIEQSMSFLSQIQWDNILFIPAFYLGDLTPEVNRASIRFLVSVVRGRQQFPNFVSNALSSNMQLIIFNIVKLFAFGMTEVGDLVSLLMALRECAVSEALAMVELVGREPLVRANVYLQTVTKLVYHLLSAPKLTGSLMRSHIVDFQETLKLIPPPQAIANISNTNLYPNNQMYDRSVQ